MCISRDQNDCDVCVSLLVIPFSDFVISSMRFTHLIKVEYLRNPMGPVAKHISTVPANPFVLVPSPTRRVTSSLHLICKRYWYQKACLCNFIRITFYLRKIYSFPIFNFSPIRRAVSFPILFIQLMIIN